MGILSSRYGAISSVSDSEGWWKGMRVSKTGKYYDPETAKTLSAVYACIQVRAQSLAQLPLQVFERDSGKVVNHDVSWLLSVEPNPNMTSSTLRETLGGHEHSWGNMYAELEFDNKDELVGIWPLRPDRTEPKLLADGTLFYQTTLNNGQQVPIKREDMVHVPGWGFDGYRGYCPILQAQESIALQGAAEEYGARLFRDGTLGGVVITHPGEMSPAATEAIKQYWIENEGGLSNAHLPRVLQEGMSFKELGLPPEGAQLIETRNFQVVEISRYWRVPLHMINEMGRANFSNVESLDLQFAKYTLASDLMKWEQEFTRKLFRGKNRGRFYVKLSLSSLLRSDAKSRGVFYQGACGGPHATVNEIRALEDMPPIDGGDELRSPVNMQTQEQMMEDKTEAPSGGNQNE